MKIKKPIRTFTFLRTYLSPFKPIFPRFYIGRIRIGTPYFFPRKWRKNPEKPGYLKAIPKKMGFDFVSLGWKTKWEDWDYRYEWSPIWSFVFFKWQIAIMFVPIEANHYWTCWLAYYKNTNVNLSPVERIKQARELFPCIWSRWDKEGKTEICYWDLILKNKYI